MRVGSAKAERIHRDERIASRRNRQWRKRGRHGHAIRRQKGIRRLEMQIRRNRPLLEDEHRLDESRQTRGRLQMTDVGFHRADQQLLRARAPVGQDRRQSLRLDGIAHRCARPVRFYIHDIARMGIDALQGLADHFLLRRLVGDRETARMPVLIRRRRDDQRARAEPQGLRGVQRHDQNGGGAFRSHVAVCARIKSAATPARREHTRVAQTDAELRRKKHIRTTDQRVIALARLQTSRGQVQRDQRGGACRVYGKTRSAQIEKIRQPIGGNRQRAADIRVSIDRRNVSSMQRWIVAVRNADKNARSATGELFRGQPRIFHGFPGSLQQPPMLRIHARGLARRDSEKSGVERFRAVDESAPARDHAARRGSIRMMKA